MSDMLRRNLAPLSAEAWQEVDETAVRVIKGQLSARALVDFSGPHGFELGAVNLGRLELGKASAGDGVPWGTRQVLPLIELRLPVVLKQMELDNLSRGCKDSDLSPLEDAARKLAHFEESVVYNGFPAGQINGILSGASHAGIKLPTDPEQLPQAVAQAIQAISAAGISGPYALVLGSHAYYPLMQAGRGGYPPRRIIRDMLEGPILWSPALDGGVVLSTRGGDFQLTVGQDIAIGYASHDREKVELYLVESFTFRILQPAAAVPLTAQAGGSQRPGQPSARRNSSRGR